MFISKYPLTRLHNAIFCTAIIIFGSELTPQVATSSNQYFLAYSHMFCYVYITIALQLYFQIDISLQLIHDSLILYTFTIIIDYKTYSHKYIEVRSQVAYP